MIPNAKWLLPLFVCVNLFIMGQPIWAMSCRAALGGGDVPKFSDKRYIDYEILFSSLTQDEVVLISMHLNLRGIQILNREVWKNHALASDRTQRESRAVRIRITDEQQYEEMTSLLGEFGSGKNLVKKLAEGEQKYSTPIMQRMAGYIEAGKIDVETVIKLDEFFRGLSKDLALKITIPLYQFEYTHGNILEENAVSIAKVFFRHGLKPTHQDSQIWGPRGDRHSVRVGWQLFNFTLINTNQVEMIFNIMSSGSSWRIEIQ